MYEYLWILVNKMKLKTHKIIYTVCVYTHRYIYTHISEYSEKQMVHLYSFIDFQC